MWNIVELLYLRLAFVRDVYLCYNPISSGFIGKLPDRPMNIPVEVRSALELVYFKLVLPQLAAAARREWRWSCCAAVVCGWRRGAGGEWVTSRCGACGVRLEGRGGCSCWVRVFRFYIPMTLGLGCWASFGPYVCWIGVAPCTRVTRRGSGTGTQGTFPPLLSPMGTKFGH
jgi:hypothetical protein